MRLIGVLNDDKQARAFSLFLKKKNIVHEVDVQANTDWGSADYGSRRYRIWILDEDQVEEALKWYHFFQSSPQDLLFQTTRQPPPPPPPVPAEEPPAQGTLWEQQPMGWITRSFLITCCLLFFAGQFTKPPLTIPANVPALTLLSSPIDKALMYDYPAFYTLLDRFIHLYGYEGLNKPEESSPEAQQLIKKINHTPFWQGAYAVVLKKGVAALFHPASLPPLFEKIRQGEVWRLFSPALLHGDLFHLFFNMIWLIVLGKQIEQRLSAGRYLFLILLLGIFSNTAQYLMSGPNFVGFSGILCGMLTFIWARQLDAPWEGYQLDRLTLSFMFIFIGGMALLQLLSFILEKSLQVGISPNIANTAHLSGALLGFLCGKRDFFSWRHS